MAQFFSLTDLGLAGSPSQLLQDWLTQMQAAYPAYQPTSADPLYVNAQIESNHASDVAQLCSAGGSELFRVFGTTLLNLPYQQGTSATAVVTITAVDTAGYTLPVGTQLTLTLNGAPLGFQTLSQLVIAPGSSSGNVNVAAVATGTTFNTAGSPAQLISQITWVSSVTVVTAASGGVDPEDDDHYRNRLVTTLQLLAPRPITASDFATIALDFTPAPGTDQQEVGRATAIDGYDPVANTYNNQREVTVCVTDANGQPLNSDTLAAIQTWLRSLRELNFLVNVVSANYTTVYVACQVHPLTGWAGATVQGNVQASLLNYLTPANWGLPPSTGTGGWTNYQTVFRSKLAAVAQNTAGVDYIEAFAFDVNSNPTNIADLSLPGPFPMPQSTTTSIPTTAITLI